MIKTTWLTADEAARRLGIRRETLYAYVSRGFVRSQPSAGRTRARRYAREDVERLRRRTEERRDPGKAAARALDWGTPVLESALSYIDGRRLFYRGQDATALATSRTVQEVASLIWTGGFDAPLAAARPSPADAVSRMLPFVARAQATLARAGAADPAAGDLRPESVARTGWQLLLLLTHVAAGSVDAAIDLTLARAWRTVRSTPLLRAALILSADHELNVSSFTARCVASAGSTPYAVVIAALSALEGTRHGGASARVEAMLAALRSARSLRRAMAERQRRGEAIEGMGHPLYPQGDPRAGALLAMLRNQVGRSGDMSFVLEVMSAARETTGDLPNLDFSLAALARVLRLPAGAPLMLFALGRTIGWIGHAIEQYATGQLIRPRARYVGEAPAPERAGRG
jgi:citrate synthase